MVASAQAVSHRTLLALIGKRLPQIFDLIPHGGQAEWVKGQPIPIPWILVGASLGRLAAQSAAAAQRSGGKPAVLMDYLDDWCPVGKPFPVPWRIPFDLGGGEDPPRPEERHQLDLHLGVLLGLAEAGSRLSDKAVSAGIDEGIGRSLGAIAGMKLV